MEIALLPLDLQYAGMTYDGWVTPSGDLYPDGDSSCYHVFLNGSFFGDMSFLEGRWLISERRPGELTTAVGNALMQTLVSRSAASSKA